VVLLNVRLIFEKTILTGGGATMAVMIDEHFLSGAGSEYDIDSDLPIRIQKRALLAALGFPGNPNLKGCRSDDDRTIARLLEEYSARGCPFLVIVSEKNPTSLIPPLFTVVGKDAVTWRNDRGQKNFISLQQARTEMNGYNPGTWLEFSPCLWGERVCGGRILYESAKEQILEVQRGTIPANLMDNKDLPTYMGGTNFLDIERYRYLEASMFLKELGYKTILPFSLVRHICKKMQPLFSGFERLRAISQKPTFEFAFTETGQPISIDIDWPEQCIEKGDER